MYFGRFSSYVFARSAGILSQKSYCPHHWCVIPMKMSGALLLAMKAARYLASYPWYGMVTTSTSYPVFLANSFPLASYHLLKSGFCLLYTSDAADEEDSVDLGGRRII